jgi:DNA-directed RNA polymerase subunit omega
MHNKTPPAEVLRLRVPSRFALVVAAAKRARQIREGARPLVDCGSAHPITIALHEIAEGKILVEAHGEVVEAAPEPQEGEATEAAEQSEGVVAPAEQPQE